MCSVGILGWKRILAKFAEPFAAFAVQGQVLFVIAYHFRKNRPCAVYIDGPSRIIILLAILFPESACDRCRHASRL